MVHHHRQTQQQRKGDEEQQLLLPPSPPMPQQQKHQHQPEEESMECGRAAHQRLWKARPRLYRLAFLFCFVSLTLLAAPRLLFGSSYPSLPFFLFGAEEQDATTMPDPEKKVDLPCSFTLDNTICCDRTTSFRTDVCVMKGDVRTRSSASQILLYDSAMKTHTKKKKNGDNTVVEMIKPYTRKWETPIMDTIDNLSLIATPSAGDSSSHECDVVHDVPAVVFSTGGYTGNVYHEFNDGILPLYITSQRFGRRVVFVMLDYHGWWVTKYGDILSQLSDYPPVDFSGDKRTHCFPEAVVGLRIHDELAIDVQQMTNGKTILDFRKMLDNAYSLRIRSIEQEEAALAAAPVSQEGSEEDAPEPSVMEKPKLAIISRNGSRGIDNEKELVSLCEEIGFSVSVLRPDRTTELAKIYRALNDSDAMIGVHGAAMTHLLFMRPGSVFIQVVPLGTDWAAETYYGAPAKRMGLKYVGYKILARESSLHQRYAKDDPVVRDPESVTRKGWKVTKEVYLDGQSVRLDLNRFLKRLTRAYGHAVSRRNRMAERWDWSWQLPQGQARPERRRR